MTLLALRRGRSSWFEEVRCAAHLVSPITMFCHRRSGRFDGNEPSLATALQGKQGVQGACALGGSSPSNLLEPSQTTSSQSQVWSVLSPEFREGQLYRTFSSYFFTVETRCLGVVQAQRTSSHLLEPPHHRESKVWRVLSHEVGEVRLYRTFSLYSVTGETRCAGCLCPRAVCVQAPRTSANLLEPHHYRASQVCGVLSPVFGVVRLYRTMSSYLVTGETRFAVCLCTSSAALQGKQGVQHLEPPRTSSNFIVAELARCEGFVRDGSSVPNLLAISVRV